MSEPVDVSTGGALVVEEIAPAGVATTDSSAVGNWPVTVPFAFTADAPGAVGALETTELSVVGNACGTLALGRGVGTGADATEGVSSLCGNGLPVMFAFSSAAC